MEPEHDSTYWGVWFFVFIILTCITAVALSITIKIVRWALGA